MRAVTFGGAMVDSIAIIDNERIERMSMRNAQNSYLLVEEGRKVEARMISQHCGGGAVNAAVSMARLGLTVSAVVKLGQDDRANIILQKLEEEGISADWVLRDPDLSTGSAVMISSHERDAAIFTYRGANTTLRTVELQDGMFDADLVYIAGLSNESADCFPEIVSRARRAGAKVATNPGIRQLTSRAGPFFQSLAEIDILAINRVEAEALLPHLAGRFGEDNSPLMEAIPDDSPRLVRSGLSSPGHDMSLRGFAHALNECGVAAVLLTNGADGAYLGTRESIYHCAPMKVDMAGSAGAGDAFASTFSAWYAQHDDPAASLRMASLNAASVIGFPDTQTGLLHRLEAEQRLASVGRDLHLTEWPL